MPPRMKSAAALSAPTQKDKTVSHRNTALPEFQRAMHGLGSSSATEKHQDRRTRRARTRSADRDRSIRDYS
ncbi:hypothetical protein SAMN04488590_3393 [Microbacterium sp. 77mftsu3.1]|nr:hypothetical protein SAMN04488590_3393 [Microbacterium sp. 77mftsu3.1]